ncbi:hypothetical protein [uncultured Acinetobacter sp.]|uniref:hypothetical protein n=1 Tax=uncultured Acinetobacter sp. TaxID=165433 RepID=UPI0037487627
MTHGIVFNHHSLPFCSKVDADNGLLAFFNVIKTCRIAGLKILLVDEDQDKSLMGLELSEGYFIRTWYALANKNPNLIEWCRFLRSIETKQPLFDTVDFNSFEDTVEIGLSGESTGRRVLLAAYMCNTFLTSFTALPVWAQPHIDVWIFELDAQPDQKEDRLINLYNDTSLEIHGEILKQRRNELINSAKDLWSQRTEFFPHLVFLPNQIGTALQSWSARQDIFLKARDALNILEEFCRKWKMGEYSEYRHEYLRELELQAEVSGESISVAINPKKKKERMFWLDDGREVYCENHIKLPDYYRLHFYPDVLKKCIYVAYLGPHLTL